MNIFELNNFSAGKTGIYKLIGVSVQQRRRKEGKYCFLLEKYLD
jgi:hypothetical protein